MKTLDRYMLKSLLVPLAYCLSAFGMLFVIWDLFDHLSKFIEARTPPAQILLYYVCLLLPTLEYLAPASLLLATLYALWQLTHRSEITAMKASGISGFRVALPLLLIGLAFTIVTGVIKETVGVRAFIWTTQVRQEGFKDGGQPAAKHLYYYARTSRRQWRIDTFREATPTVLRGVKVTQEREDGTRVADLLADKAEWLDGTWWFHNLRIQRYDVLDHPIGSPIPALPGQETVTERPEIREHPDALAAADKNWFFLSTWEMYQYLRANPDLSPTDAAHKRYDMHSRLAMPWACFIVTLFGIPAGARTGRQGVLTGIFTAVGFFFGFYALSQIGLFLGKTQALQPWLGAWLSNIVFLAVGVVMIRRMR